MRFGFDLFVGLFLGATCVALLAIRIYDDAWVGVAGFALAALVASLVAGKSRRAAMPVAPQPQPTPRGEGEPKRRPPEN